ncbi:MAG: hypothetical protein OXD54_12020 [Candidatus Poribacteria bacterium]|nr:hypothetical protein [Candidatus Poribacteria bacterium]
MNIIQYYTHKIYHIALLITAMLSVATLSGCEDRQIIGGEIFFKDETCAFTVVDGLVVPDCRPTLKIEDEDGEISYFASVADINDVYDGDTINRLMFLLHRFDEGPEPENLGVWPGIVKHIDGIYASTNVRFSGVDAAEVRRTGPWTAEEKERMVIRGKLTRDYLRSLVEKSVYGNIQRAIEIQNPEFGLYVGRTVAEVYLHINGERINLAQHLFETGYAVPYIQGYNFNWGTEVLDYQGRYNILEIENPFVPGEGEPPDPFGEIDLSSEENE